MPRYNTVTNAISLAAATAKVVAAVITPSTRRAGIDQVVIGFDSNDQAHKTVLCEIIRADTDGTGTAATPHPRDPANPPSLCTAKQDYSAAPTGNVTAIWQDNITPIGGSIILSFVDEEVIWQAVSKVLGLRLTCADAQSNVRVTLGHIE